MYNLSSEVFFYKECTVSNQRPQITFDENNAYGAYNRSRKSDDSYAVITAYSAENNDSHAVHQLNYKLDMTPHGVTWPPVSMIIFGPKEFNNVIVSSFNHIPEISNNKGTCKRLQIYFKPFHDIQSVLKTLKKRYL